MPAVSTANSVGPSLRSPHIPSHVENRNDNGLGHWAVPLAPVHQAPLGTVEILKIHAVMAGEASPVCEVLWKSACVLSRRRCHVAVDFVLGDARNISS